MVVVCSCSVDGTREPKLDPPKPEQDARFKVSYEDAVKEVESLLGVIDSPQTRSGNGKRKIANYYTTGEYALTRSGSADEPSPLVYIINFENDEGYAIVSGDSRTTPVFAITESGNLTPETVIDNPGMIGFLSNMSKIINNDIYTLQELPDLVVSTEYGPWVGTYSPGGLTPNWGQGEPFYDLAPLIDGKRAKAGCVATATALLMSYYEHPKNYNGYTFDWTLMKQHEWDGHWQGQDPSCPRGSDDMIARLFQQISLGKNLNMNFGVKESGASTGNIPRTLKNMGYSSGGSYIDYSTGRVYDELKQGNPVIAAGYSVRIPVESTILGVHIIWRFNYENGHAWVIDKYLKRARTITQIYNSGKKQTGNHYQELVRCNWGHNGGDNGYYYSGAFNKNTGDVTTKSGESGNYAFDHKIVSGIRPF